jgi:hypothetical protein
MSETVYPMATEVDQQALAQHILAQASEQGIEYIIWRNRHPNRRTPKRHHRQGKHWLIRH